MPDPTAEIPHTVRRSPRAKRVRITVTPEGQVEVVLPQRAAERQAAAALRELGPWVRKRLAEVEQRRERMARPPGTVPYLGWDLRLVPEAGRTRVHRRGLDVHVPADPAQQADALERFYRRAAREELAPRVDHAAAALGKRCTKLTIRNQRTRWGSCSSTGALAFNWRLLLAPPAVLDYVVWHECCHLVHLDHSPRFWSLVAEHCPGYREPQRWLKANGGGLTLG